MLHGVGGRCPGGPAPGRLQASLPKKTLFLKWDYCFPGLVTRSFFSSWDPSCSCRDVLGRDPAPTLTAWSGWLVARAASAMMAGVLGSVEHPDRSDHLLRVKERREPCGGAEPGLKP